MRLLLAVVVLGLVALPGRAGDWPQFRGPGGSGVADEKGLPTELGPDKNVRWKVEVSSRGISSPVIVGERLYLTACSGFNQRRLHVLCFNARTGKQLWERQFTATGPTKCHEETTMAAATPVADARGVFALFGSGDLVALDRDGDLLWYRSLLGDYPDVTNQLGLAASPVLAGDVLLLPMESAGHSFAAGLDAKTGKNLWKVERPQGTNWVTPLVVDRQGRTEAIFMTGKGVTAYDVKTGKERWEATAHKPSGTASPTPGPKGTLLIPGGELLAMRYQPDQEAPEALWKSPKLATGYTTPVYHDGKVYGLKTVGLACMDARDGSELWVERLEKNFFSSPVVADGKIYVVHAKGTLSVLKAGNEKEILASNDLGDKTLSTPAIANGALYVRTDRWLYCFGSK